MLLTPEVLGGNRRLPSFSNTWRSWQAGSRGSPPLSPRSGRTAGVSPGLINTCRVAGGGLCLSLSGSLWGGVGPPLSRPPPPWRLCWNFSAGAEEAVGSAGTAQPYLQPSADSSVPRKGLISLVICAPAGLGTHVVQWISLGTAAHLLEVRQARAGSSDWGEGRG